MAENKSVAEMLAEFFREAGLLLVVFVPLDAVIEIQRVRERLGWVYGLFALGWISIIFGMWLERTRAK